MFLAHLLLMCALVLVALGAARPLLAMMKIRKTDALVWLSTTFVLSVADTKLAITAFVIPSLIWMVRLRWFGGVMRALISAVLAGAATVGVLLLDWPFEPGLWGGAAAALTSCIVSRYRRVRLSAAFLAIPLAYLCLPVLEQTMGALGYIDRNVMLDAGVSCALLSSLFVSATEAVRRRRRLHELLPNS